MLIFNKIFNYKISRRHLFKTFSWRFLATIDTILLGFFFSGSLFSGFKIGFFELITKMFLYYFHERIWFKSRYRDERFRHIYKTITWRIMGTADTIILSSLIIGDYDLGIKIGIAEILTKMLLYFLHEKLWFRINYGLGVRKSKISKN